MARSWEYAAGKVWSRLAVAAKKREKPTYGEIAPIIPTTPRNVRLALDPIQNYCIKNRLPPLTAIVIGSGSQQPGTGFTAWDVDDLDSAYNLVFNFDWKTIENPFGGFSQYDSEDSFADEILKNQSSANEIYAKVRVRGIVQNVFRKLLLKAYGYQCAFCAMTFEEALQGSHIQPWSVSLHHERLAPQNGLLLCATHHALFDSGLMTVSRSYKIIYNDPNMTRAPYSSSDRALTVSLQGKKIHLPDNESYWPAASFLVTRHTIQKWGDLP